MLDKSMSGAGGRRALPTARDLVAWVVNELPRANLHAWLRRFDELLEFNPHCQPQVNEHYFISLERDLRATHTKASRDQARGKRDVRIRTAADGMKRDMLLLVMANGKRMADCTGTEMGAFGKGFERIAEAVGPDKRVGEVLREEDVRRLMVPRRGK
jgi:hypothetical protein